VDSSRTGHTLIVQSDSVFAQDFGFNILLVGATIFINSFLNEKVKLKNFDHSGHNPTSNS
jgi:hypothetical protein